MEGRGWRAVGGARLAARGKPPDEVRDRRRVVDPVAAPPRQLARARAVPAAEQLPRRDGHRLIRPLAAQQVVPPGLQPVGLLRRHAAALVELAVLAHEGVVVDHLVRAREEQPVLRRVAARAADHVRVELLVTRRCPLHPVVRPLGGAARVALPPEAAVVAKLCRVAAAEVVLAPQPLVDRPLRAPARRAALAVGEAHVEVAAGGPVVE